MPHGPQDRIDFYRFSILQRYLPPCAPVVSSSGTQAVHDIPKNFAGPSAQDRGPK
jgi:hypothetical protein